MMNLVVRYLLPAAALGMLIFGYAHILRSQTMVEKTEPAVKPALSPYKQTLSAAGLVEASTENIHVAAAMPGVVTEVFVTAADVGQWVKKGTPLFKVDDRHLEAQWKQQMANVAWMEQQLKKLEAMPRQEELPPARAKEKAAASHYRMMKDQAERALSLVKSGATSKEEAIQREQLMETAYHQWLQAQAELALLEAGTWDKDLEVSRAALVLAQAQVQQTQTERERAVVRAPIDGHLLKVNVRPGEYVGAQPGQTLIVLGDTTKLHVRVDVDEHDIPRFKPQRPAHAVLRGFDRRQVSLSFVRIEPFVTPKKSLTGDNTERVDTRVMQVIYAVDATDVPLFVGQQVDVFIDLAADLSSSAK